MKKALFLIAIFLSLPVLVLAANYKFTFNDVVLPDGTVTEIEAAVKDAKTNDYTRCDYFSDDYIKWLGYYTEPVAVGPDAETVKTFCVEHFAEKVQ